MPVETMQLNNQEESDNDSNWDEWQEDLNMKNMCLFCQHESSNISEGLSHLMSAHEFDLLQLKMEFEFYEYIKAINYIRTKSQTGEIVSVGSLVENKDFLANDLYLKSVLKDDVLLMIYDELDLFADTNVIQNGVNQLSIDKLENVFESDSDRIKQLEERVHQMQQVLVSYKEMTRRYIEGEAIEHPVPSAQVFNGEQDEAISSTGYYFTSYSSNEIHEEMLKDQVRTDSYRDFIYDNKDLFKGKTVLDVGCGTGILSMFAARAGASKVIAVDNAKIIEKARRIAQDNQLDGIIEFVQGRVEQVDLEKVDIIISEWMGYFLLFEGMLDSVLAARDLYLKPDGIMCPSQSNMVIAAIEDNDYLNDKYHYWNNVYGFNMTSMRQGYFKEAKIEIVNQSCVVSDSFTIQEIDIKTRAMQNLNFESDFQLTITRDSTVHGLCGWFDIIFDADSAKSVFFSTGPASKYTHWKQTLFLFTDPVKVAQGDVICGSFSCYKSSVNFRELIVSVDCKVMDKKAETKTKIKQEFHVC